MSDSVRTGDRRVRQAVLASMIGTTIEYYDFFIYGAAASLVFNKLFFSSVAPGVGLLLSLSTFAIAFVMRPVGGAIFGHFGDRFGRKRAMFVTVVLMGVATVAIGVLPTYGQVGVAAPVLLVVLRLVQGLALGGESSGGWVLTMETARPERRGLLGAVVNSGSGWGLLLGNIIFLLLSRLPEDAFLTWGWRVPFLLSAVLIVVGVYIRLRLEETPEFRRVERTVTVRKAPLAEAVRQGWRHMILVGLASIGLAINFYVASVFSLSYGTKTLGFSRGTVLSIILVVTAAMVVSTPIFGWISDRIGRKPVFVAAAVTFVVAPFVWFPLFGTGNYALMLIGFVVVFLAYSATSAVMPAFLSQVFPTEIRYSALAVSVNIGAVLGGSLAPLIATALLESSGKWLAVAAYVGVISIFSVVGGLLLPDAPGRIVGTATSAGDLAPVVS